jgi:catechol 2,3-dioxygenase-like lactoylglutathione lyase family enzyme
MGFTSAGVDIGIVVSNGPAALAFYRDVLGLTHAGDNPFPNGGTMHRLMAGESMVKIVVPEPAPAAAAPPGSIADGRGFRYITFSIDDLDAMLDACRAASVPVTRDAVEMAPGVRIALVEDPDGNTVEFLEMRPA